MASICLGLNVLIQNKFWSCGFMGVLTIQNPNKRL